MFNFLKPNPIAQIKKSGKGLILKGTEVNTKLELKMQELIQELFIEGLYKPLAKELKSIGFIKTQGEILNSQANLQRYLVQNKIIYDGTGFVYTDSSYTSAVISKELQELGATYDKYNKKWIISRNQLPQDILTEVINIEVLQSSTSTKLYTLINQANLLKPLFIEEFKTRFKQEYYNIIADTVKQVHTNLTEESISINLKFDDKIIQTIAQDYTDNLELYITNFTNQQTQELRAIINENVNKGLRSEQLVAQIQERFDVSQSKAEFLAKQETGLLTATIQEQNMLRAGIEYYMWDSARDSKVRPQHQDLNGKIFRFDNPPIVDLKTGRRANAGKDFRCRCVARPVVVDIDKLKQYYVNGYSYYMLSK
jgi:SPP1 gp7 family putative phage head morphogenesis protein